MSQLIRIAVLLAVVLAGYGLLRFMARKSLFYPWRYPQGMWEVQTRLGAEDVWMTTGDGVRIHAWFIRHPDARIVTLHLHGNAGNITLRGDVAAQVMEAGSSILLVEYRGFGRSEGAPDEPGIYRDAAAAYDWLRQRGYQPGQIVIHGESLGCAAAVELASRVPSAGVVLEAPFSSARDVAARVLPLLGPLLIGGLDAESRIGSVKVPILVMHGRRDEVIPFELGRKLFAAANEPKQFWEIPGAGHNDIHQTAGREFIVHLRKFYATL